MAEHAHNSDERRSARAGVLLTATIECDGVRISVRVVNLSAHGALVLGDSVPVEDTPINFRCNGLVVEGWVAWVRAPHAGIQFSVPVQPKTIFPKNAGLSGMVVKDTRQVTFRRPGFRGKQLTRHERQAIESWKSEQGLE